MSILLMENIGEELNKLFFHIYMKNKEIELKYLVDRLPDTYDKLMYIEQIYFIKNGKEDMINRFFPGLDLNKISTYRVRKLIDDNNKSFILTLKSKAESYTRDEYETLIDEESYNILKEKEESKIIKNRYIKIFNNYKFEFDEYLNLKEKLYTLEVELESEENIDSITHDIEHILSSNGYTFKNVTFDNRYKNNNLIKYFG